MFLQDPYEIAKFIKDTKKSTPVKLYVSGRLNNTEDCSMKLFQ